VLCDLNDTKKIRDELSNEVDKLVLTFHPESNHGKSLIGPIGSGFRYLGYSFEGNKITVRDDSAQKIRESLIRTLTYYKYSKKKDIDQLIWTINLRITGCQFNETKYGWMFYFSQITDLQLLSGLDHLVKAQIGRFGLDLKKIHVKTFTRTYFEINKNLRATKYIPNYDDISQQAKSDILHNVFKKDVSNMSDSQVNFRFKQLIFRNVKELERDLGKRS
jgi:hypothetical protein